MARLIKPAKIAVLAMLLATIGLTVAAVLVYSDSTDGQTPVLWVAIVIYGLLAILGIRLVDAGVRRIRRWRT
jgi:ABC-type nitrate/sulfonate/bicarbonate transport system permease component